MKYYDYDRADKIIELTRKIFGNNFSATLGMKEDFFLTAERVYNYGENLVNLKRKPEIAGIRGSYWATPVLRIQRGIMRVDFSMYKYEV